MKQFLSACLAVLLLAVLLVLPAAAEETADAPNLTPGFSVTAEAAYVANTDTGLVVYEKNSETPMAAASLTKLMTMILMLESYQDQLDTISITAPGYIYDYLYGKNASTADIWKDETHTLRSLLYAMLLPSANEAAYIVADYMSGSSIDNFVAMMNDEAARIGCTGTTFTDPCGLDPGNVTTARDAYLLVRVAMGYDAFAQAAGEESYQMPASTKHDSPYTILTSDKLVSPSSNYYRSYTKGGKTGSLDDWQNFAGWHTQDGETYVSVVLHSPKTDEDPRPALTETAELMDWAFATFTVTAALDTTQPITELPIVYSSQTDTVMIYPADDMQTLLPRQGGAEVTEKLSNTLKACGLNVHFAGEVPTQLELSAILDETRGQPIQIPVHTGILRSMQKARYSPEPKGHYGLVLADYAHFTSPIRRYPDLAIHRILTDMLVGKPEQELIKDYTGFATHASEQSSRQEVSAVRIERDVEDLYKAEYMHNHLGEVYTGTVAGVTPRGIFVALENTVEGFVPAAQLCKGEATVVEGVSILDPLTGKRWMLGDPVKVQVAGANVALGRIDFDYMPL